MVVQSDYLAENEPVHDIGTPLCGSSERERRFIYMRADHALLLVSLSPDRLTDICLHLGKGGMTRTVINGIWMSIIRYEWPSLHAWVQFFRSRLWSSLCSTPIPIANIVTDIEKSHRSFFFRSAIQPVRHYLRLDRSASPVIPIAANKSQTILFFWQRKGDTSQSLVVTQNLTRTANSGPRSWWKVAVRSTITLSLDVHFKPTYLSKWCALEH